MNRHEAILMVKDHAFDLAGWLEFHFPQCWHSCQQGFIRRIGDGSLRVYRGSNLYNDYAFPASDKWNCCGNLLDLLTKYEGYTLDQALELVMDGTYAVNAKPTISTSTSVTRTGPKWPERADNEDAVIRYLRDVRGIPEAYIRFLIDAGVLYQAKKYNNVVFVNRTAGHTFGELRGTLPGVTFHGMVSGCDTAGYFRFATDRDPKNLKYCFITEGSIDAMSLAVIREAAGKPFAAYCAVGGIQKESGIKAVLHMAEVNNLIPVFAFDNDGPGTAAAAVWKEQGYAVMLPPKIGKVKDWNDYLLLLNSRATKAAS